MSAEIMDAGTNSEKNFHIASGMTGAFDLPIKVAGGGVTNISVHISGQRKEVRLYSL